MKRRNMVFAVVPSNARKRAWHFREMRKLEPSPFLISFSMIDSTIAMKAGSSTSNVTGPRSSMGAPSAGARSSRVQGTQRSTTSDRIGSPASLATKPRSRICAYGTMLMTDTGTSERGAGRGTSSRRVTRTIRPVATYVVPVRPPLLKMQYGSANEKADKTLISRRDSRGPFVAARPSRPRGSSGRTSPLSRRWP